MTVARPRTAPALGRAAYQELRSFRSWHSPRAPAQPWGWWSAPGHPQPGTGYQAASSWPALPALEMTGTIVRCSLADSSSVSASSPGSAEGSRPPGSFRRLWHRPVRGQHERAGGSEGRSSQACRTQPPYGRSLSVGPAVRGQAKRARWPGGLQGGGAGMTPSVSTSHRGSGHFGQLAGGAVLGLVVGDLVHPAAPDHPDPRPGQDPHGVWVVAAASERVSVDLGRPRRGMSGVVGEGTDRPAEALVARPAEADLGVLAGLLGHWCRPGQAGDRLGVGIGWAAVAPLGEHLGGVDPTRAWQRREG